MIMNAAQIHLKNQFRNCIAELEAALLQYWLQGYLLINVKARNICCAPLWIREEDNDDNECKSSHAAVFSKSLLSYGNYKQALPNETLHINTPPDTAGVVAICLQGKKMPTFSSSLYLTLVFITSHLVCGVVTQVPVLDPEECWGHHCTSDNPDTSIRNFSVHFTNSMIEDLKYRIKNHRPFAAPLEGVGFQYGFNSLQLPAWLKYWTEEYRFEEREQFLNKYPQYKTNIQGLNIHFIRVKPQVPAEVNVVPLLLMHGWPGSVREFYEAIPLLTQQREGYDFVFEIIVPSLPGYGFSDPAVRPGLGAPQVAVVMKNLMNRLGFDKFYIQGGDWGAVIASALAVLYPENILGHHSNLVFIQNKWAVIWTTVGIENPSLVAEPEEASRMYPITEKLSFLTEEAGYFHIQATKPDTVGVGITDSPAGLLAYILEKFSTWTQATYRDLADGGLGFKFTKDQLIDNLMIYWSTNSITTSMRLYAETYSKPVRDLNIDSLPTPVPTWALQAKNEIFYSPPLVMRTKYPNLLGNTFLEDGGHFFAFQLPSIFAEDVFKAVKAFREWNAENGRSC